MQIFEEYDKDKCTTSNELISLFSQYFFDYFNSLNKNKKIFWHAKCFSINEEKIKSYLKHRSTIIKNVMLTYFLIKQNAYRPKENLKQKEQKTKNLPGYESLEKIQDGVLFYDGKKIDLNEYYSGNIVPISTSKPTEDFLDLLDF